MPSLEVIGPGAHPGLHGVDLGVERLQDRPVEVVGRHDAPAVPLSESGDRGADGCGHLVEVDEQPVVVAYAEQPLRPIPPVPRVTLPGGLDR